MATNKLRRFHGEPVRRLIVSVPLATVNAIDDTSRNRWGNCGNRSEFVRLAIDERLARTVRCADPEPVGVPDATLMLVKGEQGPKTEHYARPRPRARA